MRFGVVLLFASACASAGAPGDNPDAATDAANQQRDSSIEPTPDAPPQNVCPSAMTCQTAMMLGSVSGDQPSTPLTASGYQSAWFRVRVTEDFSEPIGLSLHVQSRLTSPAGVNFDTFVYVGSNSSAIECTTFTGTTSNQGNVDQVRAAWGESDGGISNGIDDSRNVTIEVRPVGTNCSQSQMWSLEVSGNWI